ncbi:Neuronal symmetry protein 1 [Aphelenchoides avenae]|nr:Neuronal symmetry protein 1 [Aphelenchus avenae]
MEGSSERKILHDNESQSNLEFEYELDNNGERVVLGRGTYGTVYSARDITTQRSIVVKEVEVKNEEEVQPLMEEIQLHSTLSHDNIVQYLGSKVEKRESGNDVFLIFMEAVPGGSLSSLLRNKWGPLDNEQTLAIYARQILVGLKYLHEQKIVHRDIKGDNVLVDTYSGLCKISDFGTCKRLAGLNPVTETFKGTLQYMAPEVIDHGQRGYSAPADIWSFGCTMIEMATGKPPFVELGLPQAAMFKVGMYKTHPPIPGHLSEVASAFIKSCFEPDPSRRATAAALLNDPFITQYFSTKKKRIDTSRHANNKFHRSTSHMSGMTLAAPAPAAPTTGSGIGRSNSARYNKEKQEEIVQSVKTATTEQTKGTKASERNLRLRIEPNKIPFPMGPSSASPNLYQTNMNPISFCGNQQPMTIGNATSPSVMPPSSPHKDLTTPLTASPSLCDSSPFVIMPGTSLSASDESSLNNRFFTLQKDVERRSTLVSLMREHENDIIEKWWEHLLAEVHEDEARITKDVLRQLLSGVRSFLVPKEGESLHDTLRQIREDLGSDQVAYVQLSIALYVFPNAVQPLLKLQGIKPHWIFTLDDLIRSAVQTAINILSPEQTSVLCVQEVKPFGGATVASGTVTSEAERYLSQELTQQHRFFTEQIKKLFEDLISVEREYTQLLEANVQEKSQHVERLRELVSSGHHPQQPLFPLIANHRTENGVHNELNNGPTSSAVNDGHKDDDEGLDAWLHRVGVDEASIGILTRQRYTKSDLVDFVTREELMAIGIPGGVACRIWREILRSRLELSQKFDGDTISRKYARGSAFRH